MAMDFNIDQWEEVDETDDSNQVDKSFEVEHDVEAAGVLIDEDESTSSENGSTSDVIDENCFDDTQIDVQLSSLIHLDLNTKRGVHFHVLKEIYQLMKKVRLLISFVRNHNVTNEYMKKHLSTSATNQSTGELVLDMIVRWNSTYLLLDRLIQHKDFIKGMFSFPKHLSQLSDKQKQHLKQLIIQHHEWELLTSLKKVLEPFFDAIIVLSGHNYPSLSLSFYVFRLLSKFLETNSTGEQNMDILEESLIYWFNFYCCVNLPQKQMESIQIAAFLDPMIYNMLSEDDRKSAKKLIFIFSRLKNSIINQAATSMILTLKLTPVSTTTTSKLSALKKLASSCGQSKSSVHCERVLIIDEEISTYIEADRSAHCSKEFWASHKDKLPRLCNIVHRTNIIPATSVASESLFSIAGFLNR